MALRLENFFQNSVKISALTVSICHMFNILSYGVNILHYSITTLQLFAMSMHLPQFSLHIAHFLQGRRYF